MTHATKAPKINPTENITTYGMLAGSGSSDKRATVTLVIGDDWEGLFINDQLKEQGHRLRLGNVMELLASVGPYKYEELEANDGALEVFGSFPETLTQTRREGIIQ